MIGAPIWGTIPFPYLVYKQWGHNWSILIPRWCPKAFGNAANPALLGASDAINFSLFPEVCRKLKCRKCCGKKLKLRGRKKKGKIDRKRGFNRTACRALTALLSCIDICAGKNSSRSHLHLETGKGPCLHAVGIGRGAMYTGARPSTWSLHGLVTIPRGGQTFPHKQTCPSF